MCWWTADHIPAILRQLLHFRIQYTILYNDVFECLRFFEYKGRYKHSTQHLHCFYWCEMVEKGIKRNQCRFAAAYTKICNDGFDYAWKARPPSAFLWPEFVGSISRSTHGHRFFLWAAVHGILSVPGWHLEWPTPPHPSSSWHSNQLNSNMPQCRCDVDPFNSFQWMATTEQWLL